MITSKDLPYTIEQRGGNLFKIHAAPVIGHDAEGNEMFGNEMVEFATVDEIKTFDLFKALEAERDELNEKLANVSVKNAKSK